LRRNTTTRLPDLSSVPSLVLPRAIAGRQIFPPTPHYLSQQRDNDDTRSSSSPHHRRRRSRAALNRPSAVPVAATGRRILEICLCKEHAISTLPSPSLCTFCHSAPARYLRLKPTPSYSLLPGTSRVRTIAAAAPVLRSIARPPYLSRQQDGGYL
jgi:hypothetical protein